MLKKTTFLILLSVANFAQNSLIHHEISATLKPVESFIEVVDKITIPESLLMDEIEFKLHQTLTVDSNKLITKLDGTVRAEDVGMDKDDVGSGNELELNIYRINVPKGHSGELQIILNYSGKISSPVEQSAENYARGFSESPGIIWEKGVYLAGSTYWVPYFTKDLITFDLTTSVPIEWKSVSVGKRTLNNIQDNLHIDKWESPTPQEEVFLIAAPFTEYAYPMGAVTAYAFLRTPDEGLANKYLETTAQYMEMYRKLVGPFPYTKFALIENFWETGYGMPSFTLLGEKIIRFPFILHSSYPHELLHNWWGNSVYVDFKTGNWCEGITSYMADHLIKEQRGQAAEYRLSSLQKYSNYVTPENDFPIKDFLSRHDSPSEAIGYGKTSMVFHMLRQKVGDEKFVRALQVFNRNNKFKRASFDDIRIAFEDVTDQNLSWFFDQWIERTGAPVLMLEDVSVKNIRDFNNVSFTIKQVQSDDVFYLDVPVTIVTDNGTHSEIIEMNEKEVKFSVNINEKPLKLLVDPEFDLFRKLDPRESPPTFTKAYGAENTLLLLPGKSDPDYQLYKDFSDVWIKGKEGKFKVKSADDVDALPVGVSIMLFGLENRFASVVEKAISAYDSRILEDGVRFGNRELAKEDNSFFISVVNPNDINSVITLLAIGDHAAVGGLNRKLPHYGKYSYLAFSGSEPTNIDKGQWTVNASPLIEIINPAAANRETKLKTRAALATLAPVFSADRMMESLIYLASDKMKGRGIGSPEINEAANFIAGKFDEYGIQPGADNGSYFQEWSQEILDKKILGLKNVIGLIPGNNPDIEEAVVISAHYDHLGLGWPDVKKGNAGKIHNGADDNASGVAVMLELAKILGKTYKPARTIIFVAFTAEEVGIVGSRHFLNNYQKFTVNKILANLNIDTVGRLFENKLMVLNSNTAREWKFIFMGTDFTTGIPSELIPQDLDASDQIAFIENGIPGVQLFYTGINSDYHVPEDDSDKIDADGLVKVATVAREVLEYLGDRVDPMDFTGETKNSKPIAGSVLKNSIERKATTGLMPDFSYSGEGVKIAGIAEESPAAKAGLIIGDVITTFDNKPVKNLREYSNYLKEHQPGDTVSITLQRNGQTIVINLTLAER